MSDPGAVTLTERLDGLPLALATAGAYLRQSAMSVSKYLELFDTSWARLQQRSPALMSYEDRTLYSTWQISFDQIERRSSTAARLLRFWAYFDHRDLWYELLAHLGDEDVSWMQELVADELVFEDCMRVLCGHGLAEVNAKNEFEVESRGYSVHPCVHKWICAVLDTKADAELAEAALGCIASHIPDQDLPDRSLIQRRLLSHANRYTIYIAGSKNDTRSDWASHHLGGLYADQGKLEQAEAMYIRALAGKEKALGAEHTSTLSTVICLGHLRIKQGRIEDAKALHRRARAGYNTIAPLLRGYIDSLEQSLCEAYDEHHGQAVLSDIP